MTELPDNPMKYDSDKVPLDILPVMPLIAAATGFHYGQLKYARDSWRNPDNKPVSRMRTFGSILRHLFLWKSGITTDSDSALPHLWLALTQMMILVEHVERHGYDDKVPPDKVSETDMLIPHYMKDPRHDENS